MTDREKLKTCPFCGGNVDIAKMGDNGMMWWFVTRGTGKNKCGCRVFMESDDFDVNVSTEEKLQIRNALIEAWNRRNTDE